MKLKTPKQSNITALLLKAFKQNEKIIKTTMGTFRVDRDGDVFINVEGDFIRCTQISL